jgi:hypothetical protein
MLMKQPQPHVACATSAATHGTNRSRRVEARVWRAVALNTTPTSVPYNGCQRYWTTTSYTTWAERP